MAQTRAVFKGPRGRAEALLPRESYGAGHLGRHLLPEALLCCRETDQPKLWNRWRQQVGWKQHWLRKLRVCVCLGQKLPEARSFFSGIQLPFLYK